MSQETLLKSRYGYAAPEVDGEPNAVLESLLSHRSVRSYRPEPLPDGTLERLVAAAQSASSSSNLQTWSVVAVEDPERKNQASVLCGDQDFIRQAPLFLLFCADLSRLKRISNAKHSPAEGLDFTEMFLMATIDAALAAQNAAVAAEGLGLGTCYVGAARNNPRELAQFLNLPPRAFVVFGLAVGWPEEPNTAEIKPRLGQTAVLHRESYSIDAQTAAIDDYDRILHGFYSDQKMNVTGDWTQHSARRVATVASLRGRDRLRAVLEEFEFPNR